MNTPAITTFADHYLWLESLYSLAGSTALIVVGKLLLVQIPAFKTASIINRAEAAQRMSRDYYAAAQRRASLAGGIVILFAFSCVVPFCVTDAVPLMGAALWSMFVLLMIYDFLYYLTHRFLFHDGPLGGPLLAMHSVHHQQKHPCLKDSNYLHPMETVIGLALYLVSVIIVSLVLGRFYWLMLAITSALYIQINEQNHRLMNLPYFPFRYLNKISALHHVHHARFTAGNYATITPLYDWLFGTYDIGEGHSGFWSQKGDARHHKT